MTKPKLFSLSILLFAAIACGCSTQYGQKMGVNALAPPVFQIVYTDPSIAPGLAGAVGTIVQLSGGTKAWQKNSASSTDWVVVPTSGGGGLSSDSSISQNNSASAPVTTLHLTNTFDSNTAGAEYSNWFGSVISNGAATNAFKATGTHFDIPASSGTPGSGPLGWLSGMAALHWDNTGHKLNVSDDGSTWAQVGGGPFTGHQTYTTVGATDSVAFDPTKDYLIITLGVDSTSVTVTGLDLDTDHGYDVDGDVVSASNAVSIAPNGSSNYAFGGFFTNTASSGATGATGVSSNVPFVDNATTSAHCYAFVKFRGGSGAKKRAQTIELAGGFMEEYISSSPGTTNITSLVFQSAMKAGTVITIQRTRSINN